MSKSRIEKAEIDKVQRSMMRLSAAANDFVVAIADLYHRLDQVLDEQDTADLEDLDRAIEEQREDRIEAAMMRRPEGR